MTEEANKDKKIDVEGKTEILIEIAQICTLAFLFALLNLHTCCTPLNVFF